MGEVDMYTSIQVDMWSVYVFTCVLMYIRNIAEV
jgi:hypothetical protein